MAKDDGVPNKPPEGCGQDGQSEEKVYSTAGCITLVKP